MLKKLQQLRKTLEDLPVSIEECCIASDEITLQIAAEDIQKFCLLLRDEKELKFDMLIDVCGVDYLQYGIGEWETNSTTHTGFSRGAEARADDQVTWNKPRFAVVYHFLSTSFKQRLRVRVFPDQNSLKLPSVTSIWAAANWFEREAFDLYGFVFSGHDDLRRILTDYGFVGHPFRKDFPISGHVEMRYDAGLERCVYEPVDIQPRNTVAKVIRHDNRYLDPSMQKPTSVKVKKHE